MKTLIAYATKHGSAENSAKKLAKKLNGEVDLVNLKKNKKIDIDQYDRVIIGSSVYVGKIRKEARLFSEERLTELQNKEIGLFICCMSEDEKAEQQLKDNFPEELVNKAVVTGVFGGEFDFDKMNFLEKIAIKKITGVEESQSNLMNENIIKFAEKLNDAS